MKLISDYSSSFCFDRFISTRKKKAGGEKRRKIDGNKWNFFPRVKSNAINIRILSDINDGSFLLSSSLQLIDNNYYRCCCCWDKRITRRRQHCFIYISPRSSRYLFIFVLVEASDWKPISNRQRTHNGTSFGNLYRSGNVYSSLSCAASTSN